MLFIANNIVASASESVGLTQIRKVESNSDFPHDIYVNQWKALLGLPGRGIEVIQIRAFST